MDGVRRKKRGTPGYHIFFSSPMEFELKGKKNGAVGGREEENEKKSLGDIYDSFLRLNWHFKDKGTRWRLLQGK